MRKIILILNDCRNRLKGMQMFKDIKVLGPDSVLVKELKKNSMNMFNRIPESSENRNRAKLYERYQRIIRDQILSREDEFIDALTDLVKDYPNEKEIKRVEDLFQEVLRVKINERGDKDEGKKGLDLAERIASFEATIPLTERNMVYREELKNLKKTVEKVIKEIVDFNWSEISKEDSERLYAFSEVISTSNSIIDSLLSELSINRNVDLKQGISVLLYLILRANAYLLGKISHDSLSWTISVIQAYSFANATYLIAN